MLIFFGLFFILWILVTIFLPIKDMIESRLSKGPIDDFDANVRDEQAENKINQT
ncbi:MAG: hypothetical protein JXJ04_05400 [Spirochaetales bacterium]|nr:hypothetical protein [Spirochaetales bacterium]